MKKRLGSILLTLALVFSLAPALGAIVTAGARDPELPVMARRLAGKDQT